MLLPVELLLRIGTEILRHPQTTFKQFKQLRLICKWFDQVFAPIVLSSVVVFSSYSSTVNCEMLLSLISGSGYASYAKKLVLNSWDLREVILPSDDAEDGAAPGTFWSSCIPPIKWIYGVIAVPKKARRRLREPRAVLKAKEYVECIDQVSFNLPSVQTVQWSIDRQPCHNSEKSMRINLRLLETLPSLVQLHLFLYNSSCHRTDLLAVSLPKIRNLQKLEVCIEYAGREQEGLSFIWLKDVIARCPNLRHLAIRCVSPSLSASLSELFEDVPADRHLELEHLRICDYCCDITPKVLSHLRSLTSLQICTTCYGALTPVHEIWQVLIDERIFVSKLSTNIVSDDMLRYLSHLDNLTHFSIHGPMPGALAQVVAKLLFHELAMHSSTLTHLELSPLNWSGWHWNTLAKSSLLECVELEQLTLVADVNTPQHDIKRIMECVSQTGASLTVVVETDFADIFELFISCCRTSASLEMRRLAQRMVYAHTDYLFRPM
ncbi:hypothetical protein APHAL10511_003267 [Amanita phalloides]|nr:hypothetical protein APHAL10511_003267 [Amanita phalloides]